MAKEKIQNKNTKDDQILNLDNEIIIGIKPLPKPKVPKDKISQNKKESNKSKYKP